MRRYRVTKLDRQVARACVYAFVCFWALPLAAGIWLHWGDTLVFTPWDGGALVLILAVGTYEMLKSIRGILSNL